MEVAMVVMNKTPLGTLQATRWQNGILVGVYGKGNVISFEYNPNEQTLEITINDDALKEQNIQIQYMSQTEFNGG
jgi:hypothetical protein